MRARDDAVNTSDGTHVALTANRVLHTAKTRTLRHSSRQPWVACTAAIRAARAKRPSTVRSIRVRSAPKPAHASRFRAGKIFRSGEGISREGRVICAHLFSGKRANVYATASK
jgi:hypothetical protein